MLSLRCQSTALEGKRKRSENRQGKGQLVVVTFLQVSVLILSRLTLRHSSTWPVCSWAAASSAHRLEICSGDTRNTRPSLLSPGNSSLQPVDLVILPHRATRPLKQFPDGLHSPPSCTSCQAPFSFTRTSTQSRKSVSVPIFMLSTLRSDQTVPRLVTKKAILYDTGGRWYSQVKYQKQMLYKGSGSTQTHNLATHTHTHTKGS